MASLSFTVLAVGQQSQRPQEAAASVRKRIYVDGKAIVASKVITKDGLSYVDPAALAEALGASVESGETGLQISSAPKPSCESEKTAAEGEPISELFRHDVAKVADEIESLRAVVLKLKKETTAIGPRFDELDYELSLSRVHAKTAADWAIYYALSSANNSLAIVYYKQVRGIPFQELQAEQVDSMMCAMESKFAIMRGVLLPGGSCSVFKRLDAQLPLQPPESPDKE
jgi:hypothetical protein